jgi:organic radical activating enzyme
MSLQQVANHPAREVYLTGGEPLILPERDLLHIASTLRNVGKKVFIYSAKASPVHTWRQLMGVVDGVTFTLHNHDDFAPFAGLHTALVQAVPLQHKSLRLNVTTDARGCGATSGAMIRSIHDYWDVIDKRILAECPVPDGELFAQLDWEK